MKKIVFFLFATMLVASVKAQVYVGGTVGLWHNDDLDATFFKLEPEVGYNLSEKWAVGGVLAFAHGNRRQRLRIRLHQRRPLIRFPLRVLIPDKA